MNVEVDKITRPYGYVRVLAIIWCTKVSRLATGRNNYLSGMSVGALYTSSESRLMMHEAEQDALKAAVQSGIYQA